LNSAVGFKCASQKVELTFRQAQPAPCFAAKAKKGDTMFSLNHRPSFRPRSVLSINRSLTSVVLGLWAAIMISSPAFAQSVTGNISGSVTDPNGAVVAGASVTLVNDQTKDKRDQVTNDSGRFNFASVQPGVYTLRIEHAGFETLLRTKVVLSANEGLALGDIALKTGQVTERVEQDKHDHQPGCDRRSQSTAQ